MQETTVRPVADKRESKYFINYQYDRNRGDAHFIPPLRVGETEKLTPRKNPFFAHADVELLLAHRGGRVAGRIAAIDDHLHNQTHGDSVAMFGFFEADDEDAAHALLARVERWAKAKGRRAVRGPLNPSLNESAGLLISGFDTDPMLMMPRNPREYASFIEAAGYAKVKDLYAWIYDLSRDVPPLFKRLAEKVQRECGISVRPIDLKEFANEADRLREIYCRAWKQNWGFVAPTTAELGVLPQYRTIGIYPLLICELYRLVREKTRYKRIEFPWVLEDNHAINQTVERMGAVHHQTYRIYQKALL